MFSFKHASTDVQFCHFKNAKICSCLLLIILGKISIEVADFFPLLKSVSVYLPLLPRKSNEYLRLNQIGVSNQVVLIFARVRNEIYGDN